VNKIAIECEKKAKPKITPTDYMKVLFSNDFLNENEKEINHLKSLNKQNDNQSTAPNTEKDAYKLPLNVLKFRNINPMRLTLNPDSTRYKTFSTE